tara:strand:- start:1084 stop:1728 length:645 start_codon:yes stop_codon:yes gene_type:complete
MIDKTAHIGKNVKIGNNVSIGKYCIIEGDVEIGDDTNISHFCTIGTPAQTVPTDYIGKIKIGKRNTIREYVSINMPFRDITSIGNDNFIMSSANIGHDIKIGNNVVVCVGSQIGGHCTIGNYVKLGLNSCLHQFTKIGSYTMIGMGAQVRLNIPPFSIVENEKVGFDLIGLTRSNIKNRREARKAHLQYKKDKDNFNPKNYDDEIRNIYEEFLK